MDDEDDLALAWRLADLADGHTAVAFGGGRLAASSKADGSLVSAVDLEVERSIRAELTVHRPGDAFLGEETPPSDGESDGESDGGSDGGSRRRWVVDPIDHTNNFVRGIPAFATLIALMVDEVVAVGVVSAPALGRRWWARRGHGAFTDDGRRLRVSAVADLADAYLSYAAVHVWQERGRLDGIVELSRRARFVYGSGGFRAHMLVAEGLLDASLDPWGKVWDLAPIQVIVEEAGGALTDISGVARVDGGCAVVTNGVLHATVLSALNAQRRK
jgi:histidinol-phosphatase